MNWHMRPFARRHCGGPLLRVQYPPCTGCVPQRCRCCPDTSFNPSNPHHTTLPTAHPPGGWSQWPTCALLPTHKFAPRRPPHRTTNPPLPSPSHSHPTLTPALPHPPPPHPPTCTHTLPTPAPESARWWSVCTVNTGGCDMVGGRVCVYPGKCVGVERRNGVVDGWVRLCG